MPNAVSATFEFPSLARRKFSPVTRSHTFQKTQSSKARKKMTNNKENIVKPKLCRKNSDLELENTLSIQSPRFV